MITGEPITILLADDDEDDCLLARKALTANRLANDFHIVNDGQELLDYVFHQGKYVNPEDAPRPDLILLDLNMPGINGHEALAEIKRDPQLRQIPIVILTTSQAEEDVFRSYDLGANSFVSKPVTFQGLVDCLSKMGQYWFETVALPEGS